MGFILKDVVPWGRNLNEYRKMFNLTDEELANKKIIGFGDGPASFNSEAKKLGYDVTSLDPIYQFTNIELDKRISETRGIIIDQLKNNADNYIWKDIKNIDELEYVRMSAMKTFIADYDEGKLNRRYIYHELPNRTEFKEDTFHIGLSSHFLLMYTTLGYDFHIKSIAEMLRICREVRIFPVVDLDGNKSELINRVIEYFKDRYEVQLVPTSYEFQKCDNFMLSIKK
ncbi:MAG: SAM-dependent methyltransferase [Solirubrobacterales bacterium]